MPVTVEDIINKPFSSRTEDEKFKIVAEGKPRPLLKMAAVVSVKSETHGGALLTQQFNPSMYDDTKWLTGCEIRNAFFCWPCLLFKPPLGLWNSTGVVDLTYLMEGLHKHEESVEHISAALNLQSLVEQHIQISGIVDVVQHNEIVKRNQEIFRRLIDILCNLLIKEQSHYERKNGCQIDTDECVRNLLFLRTYDTLNCNYIEDAVELIKISANVVHDLVDTLAKVVKLSIRKEIQLSTYVSIILSDHSKIAHQSQISTVLRYIKDGKVLEKFTGFLNMGDKKNLAQVFQHITNTVAEFGISEKLISVSLDGGILPTNELIEFADTMKNAYPHTFLVPWYCHSVEYVLLQSLTKIKECSVILKAISEMKLYFHKKSKRFKGLESFMTSNLPSVKNTKWFTRTQFIQLVQKYRKYFILFFESVLQNSTMWEADDLTKALGFQQILEDFQTMFLLQVFARLIDILTPLIDAFMEFSSENLFTSNVAREAIKLLSEERDIKFEDYWSNAVLEKSVVLPGPSPKRLKVDVDDPKFSEFHELYRLIFGRVIEEVSIRYLKLGKMKFCQLLCCDKLGNFVFTNEMLYLLIAALGDHFDEEQTKNELIVLRTNGKQFARKSVYGLLDIFIQLKLKSGFKYLYKLAELILTLPTKPPTEGNQHSKFEEINEWSYIPEVLGIQTGDVSVSCLEMDILQELKKSSTFYNDVYEVFYDGNKTFELEPK